MLKKAEERDIYQTLIAGDLVDSFKSPKLAHQRFDFFAAVDVFVYLGDLKPILRACQRAASLGAVLAFSTEAIEEDEGKAPAIATLRQCYHLGSSGRYSHSRSYIKSLAKDLGWEVVALRTETIRQQKGVDLKGHLVVLRLPDKPRAL